MNHRSLSIQSLFWRINSHMCRETPINTDWEQGLTKERPTLVANQREEKNKIKRIKIKTAKLAIMGAD